MAAEASGIALHPKVNLFYKKLDQSWESKKDWLFEGVPETGFVPQEPVPQDLIGYPGSYPGGY